MRLDVNTDAAIILTAKLERLHRSAFPSAVRNTLNDAAFATKKLIPQKASENFKTRQKNLFSKFSSVEKAKGFSLSNMKSKVGLSGTQNKLLDGLEKQETGGTFTGRKLVAMNQSRISGSNTKKIQSKYNFAKMPKSGRRGKSQNGSKYFFIKKGNKGTLFENVGKNRIKPIYHLRPSNRTTVKAKPFIAPSAIQVSKQLDEIYKKNAEFQFKKFIK